MLFYSLRHPPLPSAAPPAQKDGSAGRKTHLLKNKSKMFLLLPIMFPLLPVGIMLRNVLRTPILSSLWVILAHNWLFTQGLLKLLS